MCGHIMFMTPSSSLASRHLWRCSVCGRASQAPLDCCARPDYAPQPSRSLIRTTWRWLGMAGHALYASLLTRWTGDHEAVAQPEVHVKASVTGDEASAKSPSARDPESPEHAAQEAEDLLVEV